LRSIYGGRFPGEMGACKSLTETGGRVLWRRLE
jgi:hypothetical protein